MIATPLELRLRPEAAEPLAPEAWFVPGAEARGWLDEFARWRTNLAGAKLYVVPASPAERRACGVLAVLASNPPLRVLRAQPYGRWGERLFLPANAEIFPALAPGELRELLPLSNYVWHPAAGLVGFGADDAREVCDLLAVPKLVEENWRMARPGASPYPRLRQAEPDEPASLTIVIEQSRGDIGSRDPRELPKAPHEASGLGGALGALGALGANMARGLARALSGPASGSSGGGSGTGAGGLGGLAGWLSSSLIAWSARLMEARRRELDRLLHLLDRDPDEALRYALPLSGGASRGIATPGDRLTARSPDFNLGRLGGGGPADLWRVDPDVERQLRRKYLEAANRELALGRHRRAAFIFAELLGDYAAAASALKQGRHYREAAVVYRDLLKNPRMAAQCLADGGLLLEAVALYEELGDWLKAAELYRKLERHADAERALRKGADQCLARQDLIGAARIYDEKLSAPDEALAVLAFGWPEHPQAQACLQAQYALLGRLGRHAEAQRITAGLSHGELEAAYARPAAEVLARIAHAYPDAPLRMQAADAARVVAGRRMGEAHYAEARELARALHAAFPDDLLLTRDTNRFLQAMERQRVLPPTKAVGRGRPPELVRGFKLPGGIAWKHAVSAGDLLFAGGAGSRSVTIARALWSGSVQTLASLDRNLGGETLLRLCAPRHLSNPLLVMPMRTHQRLPMHEFIATRDFPPGRAGTPEWLPADFAAVCYDEHDAVWVLRALDDFTWVLSAFTPGGELISEHDLGQEFSQIHRGEPLLAARQRRVFVAKDRRLFTLGDGKVATMDLPGAVQALAVSAPFSRVRIALSFEEGGSIVWPAALGEEDLVQGFGQGLVRPRVAMTRGGILAAADAREMRAYQTEGRRLRFLGECKHAGPEPVAVVPAAGANEFALLLPSGSVQVYCVKEN